MDKRIITIHRILFFISTAMLAGSLIFYLIRWGSLPSQIGVHFDGDGNFDVIESKMYGFYPHIIGGIITAGIAIAQSVISKKKTGLDITGKGEELFRAELLLTLDIFLMLWCVLFSMWSRSVALQIPLPTEAVNKFAGAAGILILIGIVSQIVTCIVSRDKAADKKSTGLSHRLCRLIPWLLTVSAALIQLELWERYPLGSEYYGKAEYYGLAWSENLGKFIDKRLLLIPLIFAVAVLAVLEVINTKASSAGKDALVSFTDRIKLICGAFFFFWDFLIKTELGIGMVSPVIFALLCAVSAVVCVKDKKKKV